MKRRRILLVLTLAAVAAAGLVLLWPRGPKEPVYQGKTLSQWIREANAPPVLDWNQPSSLQSNAAARTAVRAIGTNAVPYLVSEFVRPESKWRTSFNRWASKHPTIPFRFADFDSRVLTAANGLGILGRDAAPALPKLAEFLGDGRLGFTAAMAMGKAGDLAIPYLLKAIASTNTPAAENAGNSIATHIRDAETAIPGLIQLLQHTNDATRRVAAWTLGALPSQSPPIVPALTAALTDPVPRVQAHAAHALARKGKSAMSAVPALLRLMTNSDPELAFAASNAVALVDPAALPARRP